MSPVHALFAAAAALSLAAVSAPAAAGGVEVKHGDLDLGTAAGKAELDARIRAAARSYCADAEGAVTGTRLPSRECQAEIARQFKAQVSAAVARKDGTRLAAANGSAPAAP